MLPDNFKFGGGPAETLLHPVVLAALLIAIPAILFVRRKYVSAPVLLLAFLVPLGQQVVVGGIHIMVLRIVILTGLIRMVFSKPGKLDTIDKLFLLWALIRAASFLLLFSEMAALINQFGFLWDTIGGFFLLRFLVQSEEDVQRLIKALAFVAVILAACMLYERFGKVNVFGYLGGVPIVPTVREGSLRAQGPFAHALLAGTFGATLLPFFIWLWTTRQSRILAMSGVAASTIIAILSASSSPIMAYAAAVFAMCLWPLRNYLQIFRWGFVIALVALALIMKAPVWFLIARIDLIGGSSGYHRAMLIDQFIRHFSDWWLVGTNANGTWGWDLWDTCNQYVTEGESGGLAALACFVAMISVAFARLGQARKMQTGNPPREWFFWSLGAALFAHVVAFWGIAYFDQTRMLWFAMLATVIAATSSVMARENVEEPETMEQPLTTPQWAWSAEASARLHDDMLSESHW